MAELTIFKAKWLANNDNNSHNYSTITTIVMGVWYLRYVRHCSTILCILTYLILIKSPREESISGRKMWTEIDIELCVMELLGN